ncbi:hypothetical protein BD410DRAFT_606317 [Rickenella mellea]|uniref:Uncharacterized protein n=1 Tax=Rickenella mellea TaxID=50990 RepID=A0A4Y7QF70_9AGAM|nr:hypothetical protein BD410DRAFT_606317 [Rickenella mellea]
MTCRCHESLQARLKAQSGSSQHRRQRSVRSCTGHQTLYCGIIIYCVNNITYVNVSNDWTAVQVPTPVIPVHQPIAHDMTPNRGLLHLRPIFQR